jgi:hypothetical protein
MTTKQLEQLRERLRREYHALKKWENRLAWCNEKARELDMSYGEFCSWLGV